MFQQSGRPKKPVLDFGLFAKRGSPSGKFKGRAKSVPGKMNRTETEYAEGLEARRLEGDLLWWAFESIKLRLADNTFLTVDFAVMYNDLTLGLHEVKGGGPLDSESETKLKVAAELYPFMFVRAEKLRKKDGGGWKIRILNTTEEPA